ARRPPRARARPGYARGGRRPACAASAARASPPPPGGDWRRTKAPPSAHRAPQGAAGRGKCREGHPYLAYLRIARAATGGLACSLTHRMAATLFTQNIIACIWDFDKTLIPDYMQSPLFRRYGVNEATFWAETNALVENYRKRGYTLSGEIGYLIHLLTYVLCGQMGGLNNAILKMCGSEIRFYPGLPEFFADSKSWAADKPEYRKHDIRLEHYIVSTGLAQMIRGSAIAPHVDGIWGCEFIENPLQPGFLQQKELDLSAE